MANLPKTQQASDIDDESRDRQVIASGFNDDTDADVIIKELDNFLSIGNRRAKVTKVFTFSDPSPIGVIEFQTM